MSSLKNLHPNRGTKNEDYSGILKASISHELSVMKDLTEENKKVQNSKMNDNRAPS